MPQVRGYTSHLPFQAAECSFDVTGPPGNIYASAPPARRQPSGEYTAGAFGPPEGMSRRRQAGYSPVGFGPEVTPGLTGSARGPCCPGSWRPLGGAVLSGPVLRGPVLALSLTERRRTGTALALTGLTLPGLTARHLTAAGELPTAGHLATPETGLAVGGAGDRGGTTVVADHVTGRETHPEQQAPAMTAAATGVFSFCTKPPWEPVVGAGAGTDVPRCSCGTSKVRCGGGPAGPGYCTFG